MWTDRVGELLEGGAPRWRIVTPEGLPLLVTAAGRGDRLAAFGLDLLFMAAAVIALYLLVPMLFLSRAGGPVSLTLVLFAVFVVRNLYFLHFELAWQGRTPGKRLCGLRVVNRRGGELSSSALIARNLTREVEVFLPLSLFANASASGGWRPLVPLFWALLLAALPLFNRLRLRAGDLLAGTLVIAMPKRLLLEDLAVRAPAAGRPRQVFKPDQLAVYGNFELQVLEEFLRRPAGAGTEAALAEICGKIRRKIGWDAEVAPEEIRNFLTDFYAAERQELERRQLFGKARADKTAGKP